MTARKGVLARTVRTRARRAVVIRVEREGRRGLEVFVFRVGGPDVVVCVGGRQSVT